MSLSLFVMNIFMSVFALCIPLVWIVMGFVHARRRRALCDAPRKCFACSHTLDRGQECCPECGKKQRLGEAQAQELHQVRLRSIEVRKRLLPIQIPVLIALAVCALVPVVMGSLAVAGFRVPAWAVADRWVTSTRATIPGDPGRGDIDINCNIDGLSAVNTGRPPTVLEVDGVRVSVQSRTVPTGGVLKREYFQFRPSAVEASLERKRMDGRWFGFKSAMRLPLAQPPWSIGFKGPTVGQDDAAAIHWLAVRIESAFGSSTNTPSLALSFPEAKRIAEQMVAIRSNPNGFVVGQNGSGPPIAVFMMLRSEISIVQMMFWFYALEVIIGIIVAWRLRDEPGVRHRPWWMDFGMESIIGHLLVCVIKMVRVIKIFR